jgi:radical SAM superfamily enzyme YgiQ (UPF0313 family)
MALDILFVHPNSASSTYQGLSSEWSAIEPPIWASLLCNHCLKNGFKADILDAEALGLTDTDIAYTVVSYKPKYVCFVVYGAQPSASSQNMEGAVSAASRVREVSDVKIIFVGGHVSALPVETLEKHSCIDICCTNEGFNSIIGILQSNNPPCVRGLALRLGDNIIRTEPGVLSDLKDFSGMAWDLLPMNRYRTALWHALPNGSERRPFASLYTSLGCPFSCGFCMINSPFGGSSFRYWDPTVIIEEFEKLARKGIKNVKIADEMFVMRESHFMRLCELIIERGYDFNIWCYARVDTVKEKYLSTLKRAGVNYLALGIESANTAVKDNVAKTQKVDPRLIVSQVHGAGIHVAANYIFGLPKDTMETMQETLSLAQELNTEMANFYSCMAYPGSALYKTALENGWELPSTYSGYSQHSYECQPLPTEFVSAADVLRFRDKAWHTYHTNPLFLSMIESKFGAVARENIEASTKIKLKRRLLDGCESGVAEGCSKG